MRTAVALFPLLFLTACSEAPPAQTPPGAVAPETSASDAPSPSDKPTEPAPSAAAETPAPPPLKPGDLATIASPCGVYVYFQAPSGPVSALLKARELRTTQPPIASVWLLDGALVELAVVHNAQMQAPGLTGQPLLDHYRGWQLRGLAQVSGWTAPTPEVFMAQKAHSGSPLEAQVWAFTAPGPMLVLDVPVTGMAYAALAIDEFVLTAAVPFRPGDDPQRSLAIFVSFLNTIEKVEGAVDVAAHSALVRREAEADPTCARLHGATAPAPSSPH